MKFCVLCFFDDLMLKDTGASIRIYYLAKSLAELGHKVHIVIPGDKEALEWTDGVFVHRTKGLCPYWVLRFFSALLGVSRATSLFFYDLSFILRASRVILKSDAVQIEEPVSAPLIALFVRSILKKPIIVDVHDTFQALRIKYQNSLRKILEIFFEKITYKYSKLILTVSDQDKDFLVKYGVDQDRIRVIPNGVDTEAFKRSMKKTKIKTLYDLQEFYKVIFVGNMEYLPNQEAANLITSHIAPKVLSKIGNVKFLLVGRAPPEVLTNSSDVVFTGVVEDVAEFLEASDVAIAPLLQGSGTRLKILEYFSCGLPVVSTSIGAEGLDAENGVNILIEDKIDKLAMKIVDLLMNKELRVKLGTAARELAMKKYDWRIIGKQLDAVYSLINRNEAVRNEN
jgi:glycosyltransferase involved in cell wall biosynthesis